MPNCFALYLKGSNQPEVLQRIDEELCKHFGADVHPKYWLEGWYNCIGFLIAMHGDALDSPALRERVIKWYEDYHDADEREQRLTNQLAILDYLKDRYTSQAWVEIGKRA